MFDNDTVNLMRGAPVLEGLDLDALPQELTNAYTSIVTARVRMREMEGQELFSEEIIEILKKMRRLAYTNEALVAAVPDRDNRAAAAFVAGAAHHVCLMFGKKNANLLNDDILSLSSISPEVSAMLLFLIAEATADAAEMAKTIAVNTDNPVKQNLLLSLINLATGKLANIINNSLPAITYFENIAASEQAVSGLYFILLKGVRALATEMLQVNNVPARKKSIDFFKEAMNLCAEPIEGISFGAGMPPSNIYPGPLHLASLLLSVAKDLVCAAVVAVNPPNTIDQVSWVSMMKNIAQRRPYLWRNHRQAISEGYLDIGTSAVVSFPTGAGKSTLAELKIATTLLRGKKIVFLAPTLALVDQTAVALESTFKEVRVEKELAEQTIFSEFLFETLPSISVMTPERCLAMMGFDRTVFSDIGLLIFDECHLLHSPQGDTSRRAIDAMLCVLNFLQSTLDADMLFLSAMMKNGREISLWLHSLTGRPCLALDLKWKPTRQARGCVVYDAQDIKKLNNILLLTRRNSSAKGVPGEIKRNLVAKPYGFFCLHQTWQSNAREDYTYLPLVDETLKLSTGTAKSGNWYLTPNGVQVAAALAVATANKKMKTLIFAQTIPLVNSAVKTLNNALTVQNPVLLQDEYEMYEKAVMDAGGSEYVYLNVQGGKLYSASVCHHGLLLPIERRLHESIFKRADGVMVMVATSTLAQGMNLPSEVVIIAGDSRFDPSAEQLERLEAHELLNAAGRAGRAGESSYGLVLVVPSKVVGFADDTSLIAPHWSELQAIFAQSDQCLDIDDPLTALLDEIYLAAADDNEMTRYLKLRLSISGDDSGKDDTEALLNRSFAAYRARVRNDLSWIQSRVNAVIAAQKPDPAIAWAQQLAANMGVDLDVIVDLGDSLNALVQPNIADVIQWREWVFDWLVNRASTAQSFYLIRLIRHEALEKLFGKDYKTLQSDAERADFATPKLRKLLTIWMSGGTLVDIELEYGTSESKLGMCEHAREFVLKMITELAYLFSLPLLVVQALNRRNGVEVANPGLALSTLAACVKEGFDSPEKLALKHLQKGALSRVGVHKEFERIRHNIPPATEVEDLARTKARVARAV